MKDKLVLVYKYMHVVSGYYYPHGLNSWPDFVDSQMSNKDVDYINSVKHLVDEYILDCSLPLVVNCFNHYCFLTNKRLIAQTK